MRRILLLLFISLSCISGASASVTYPTSTPAGEIPGGAFQRYFDNMYLMTGVVDTTPSYTEGCPLGLVIRGFDSMGRLKCISPAATTFTLPGSQAGDTVRYDGSNWIRTSFLYNNGSAIGIGTTSPAYPLDVNGDIIANQFRSRGTNGWFNETYGGGFYMNEPAWIRTYGDRGVWTEYGLLGSQKGLSVGYWGAASATGGAIFSGSVGIGTQTPGAKLEVVGQVKITGGGVGSGKFLVSDATGLASWTDIVPATTLTISGSQLGDTIYYNGTNWSRTNNIFHTGGNVGIGTQTPSTKLEVAGQVKITGGAPGVGKVLVSDATGLSSWGFAPVPCVAAGTGLGNTCYGTGTLQNNTTGIYNTAVGISSLQANTTGNYNTAHGAEALFRNTTGIQNTAIGMRALQFTTVGSSNTANGMGSMGSNVSGQNNTAMGVSSLEWSTSGNNNVAIGTWSLAWNTIGSQNTGIGDNALVYNTTGNNNTAIGRSAGNNLSSGDNNIAIGVNTNFASATGSNQLNIGNWIYGSGGNIGIGQSNPQAKLDINGKVRIADGTQGSGKVLVTDSGGIASWGDYTPTNIKIGDGNPNYVVRWNATATGLVNSIIYDDGQYLGIRIRPNVDGAGIPFSGGTNVTIDSVGSFGMRANTASPNAYWDHFYFWHDGWTAFVDAGGANGGLALRTAVNNWSGSEMTVGGSYGKQAYLEGFRVQPDGSAVMATKRNWGSTGSWASSLYPKVGIGTYSPQVLLHVNDEMNPMILNTTTLPIARFTRPQTSGIKWGSALDINLGTYDAGNIASRTQVDFRLANGGTDSPDTNIMTLQGNGNVGIGTTTPTAMLEVAGQVKITGGAPGVGKILTSDATGLATWSSGFSGTMSASGIVGGTQNYVPKFGTGGNGLILSQIYDTGTGVAVGSTTPGSKFEIWSGATSIFHMRGTNNLGLGLASVRYQTSGSANVGVGNSSLRTLTTGYSNSAIGDSTLYNNTSGYFNSALGSQSLYSNSIGNWNVGLGSQALWTNISGNYNIALGGQALYSLSNGSDNIGIGYQALRATLGNSNIAIGSNAGSSITSGVNNILIGANTTVPSNTASNQLNIGDWIFGENGNIGIGTSPGLTAKFTVDSGVSNTSGVRISQIGATTPVFTGVAAPLGVDASGNIVIAQQGAIPVYTALGSSPNAAINTTSNPPTIGANYDRYFNINARQSFTVTDVGGMPYNCPEFQIGATNKGATGCSQSPWATYVMTAQNSTSGNRYAYQILLSDRTDAPFVVRGGMYSSANGTLMNSAMTIPALWFKALTVPTNHSDWLYVNPGVDQNNNPISGGGNVGLGTLSPQQTLHVNGGSWFGVQASSADAFQSNGSNNVNIVTPSQLASTALTSPETALRLIRAGRSGVKYNPSADFQIGTYITGVNALTSLNIRLGNGASQTPDTNIMTLQGNGNVGIGTTTPTTTLEVAGQVKITGGSPAAGRVLTSDATGLATWQAPSGGGGGASLVQSTVNRNLPSIANNACDDENFALPGATTGKVAWISPNGSLGTSVSTTLFVASTYISAADTVTVRFCNESGTAINLGAMDFYVAAIQ